jgi:bifunctional DNA-binding transcriptional regulator/antitoxin component of YhaV-PrlF toxin-antitoxin module
MQRTSLSLAPNGRIVIPVAMRAALGCQNGGKLVARLVDGALVLEPVDVAIRRAQAMVRAYIPENAGVVDELIAERHAAAELE